MSQPHRPINRQGDSHNIRHLLYNTKLTSITTPLVVLSSRWTRCSSSAPTRPASLGRYLASECCPSPDISSPKGLFTATTSSVSKIGWVQAACSLDFFKQVQFKFKFKFRSPNSS